MTTERVDAAVSSFLETALPGEKLEIQDRLVDGTANFLYRVKSSTSGKTYIIKHAEPFIKNNPTVQFPTNRMDFEAGVLMKLPAVLLLDDVVQPVHVFKYDTENHNLLMSDGGPRNLKAAYSNPKLDVKLVGQMLGSWLARFHQSTKDLGIGDHALAKMIYRWSYNHLAEAQKEFGLDSKLGEEINAEFGAKLATDDGMLCHGDFWTGNIIVDTETDQLKLTVVDWEMTRMGNGMTDVGQFAAESWLLDRFQGGRGILGAFLQGYKSTKDEISESDLQRIVIHFATHISYWPTRVDWGTKEETTELVKVGYEYLKRGQAKDWQWLKESDLKDLF
jgi:5-methylthioribose kinase